MAQPEADESPFFTVYTTDSFKNPMFSTAMKVADKNEIMQKRIAEKESLKPLSEFE